MQMLGQLLKRGGPALSTSSASPHPQRRQSLAPEATPSARSPGTVAISSGFCSSCAAALNQETEVAWTGHFTPLSLCFYFQKVGKNLLSQERLWLR